MVCQRFDPLKLNAFNESVIHLWHRYQTNVHDVHLILIVLSVFQYVHFVTLPSLLGMCALVRNPIDSCPMGVNHQSDAYHLPLRRFGAVSGPAKLSQ